MKRTLLLVFGAVLALPVFAASAALPENTAVLAGTAYLRTVQEPDGGFGGDLPTQSMDTFFAFRAAGYDPAKETVNGVGPVQFLTAKVGSLANSAESAKAALAARALGLDPRNVGGTNLIADVEAGFDSATNTYNPGDAFSHSVAILGLECTGNNVPNAAVTALKDSQLDSGGWGFGGFSDPDTSAIAVQALLAAGVPASDAAVADALDFLKESQASDGGWGFDPSASNASSTAYVVQALIALGKNPESAEFTRGGATPVSFLLSQQQANGSFIGFDATYSTNQVVPALAGRTFCNAPETPITRTKPVVAPTPTPTAPPTSTPPTAQPTSAPASPSPAPKPPSTGDSAEADGRNELGVLVGIGLVLMAGSLAWYSRSARR